MDLGKIIRTQNKVYDVHTSHSVGTPHTLTVAAIKKRKTNQMDKKSIQKIIKFLSWIALPISIIWLIISSFDFEPILVLIASVGGILSDYLASRKDLNIEDFTPKVFNKIGNMLDPNDFVKEVKIYGFELDLHDKNDFTERLIYEIPYEADFKDRKHYRLVWYDDRINKLKSIGLATTDKEFYFKFRKSIINNNQYESKEFETTRFNEEKGFKEHIWVEEHLYLGKQMIQEKIGERDGRHYDLVRTKKINTNQIAISRDSMPKDFFIGYTYKFEFHYENSNERLE